MNTKAIFGVVAVLVLIVVAMSFGGSDHSEMAATDTTSDKMATADHSNTMTDKMDDEMSEDMADAEMMEDEMEAEGMKDDMMKDEMEKEAVTEIVPEARELVAGIYTDYTASAVASSEADYIVLNFSATWCPSCRTLDKNITENAANIPDGVEIYKVDYDTNTDLRKKYGVTSQHSLVLVTADGEMIKKWNGGTNLDSVLSEL